MRPINIKNIIMNSPIGDNEPVSPRDKPTVPIADTASNAISINGASSTKSKVKIANQVTPAHGKIIIN